MNTTTSGTTASAAAATISDAQRHPWCSVTSATTGRKISWPVALAAVSTPVTRPRRASNHRVATVATKPIEIDPVPTPTSTPHSSTSCQLAVMNTLSADPAAMSISAAESTGRTPNRSIRAAANGCRQAEQRHVDRHRQPDRAVRPAELVVQRGHHHAGHRAETRGAEDGDEADGGHHPGPVDAAVWRAFVCGGERHQNTVSDRDRPAA